MIGRHNQRQLSRFAGKRTGKRRLRDDSGNSLIMLVIFFMMVFLVFGFAVDGIKNITIRSQYQDAAQDAVRTAVKAQDGNGGLLCSAGTKTFNSVSAATAYAKGGTNNSDRAMRLAVTGYLESTGRDIGTTSTFTTGADSGIGNNSTFVTSMRSVIGDKARFDNDPEHFNMKVWCSTGFSNSGVGNGSASGSANTSVGHGNTTNVINMQVTDWSGNFILGAFGLPEQDYLLDARAISSWNANAVG